MLDDVWQPVGKDSCHVNASFTGLIYVCYIPFSHCVSCVRIRCEHFSKGSVLWLHAGMKHFGQTVANTQRPIAQFPRAE